MTKHTNPGTHDQHRHAAATLVGAGTGFPKPEWVPEPWDGQPLDLLGFAHAALNALAGTCGYDDAQKALTDFEAEPFEPYGVREGGALVGSIGTEWAEPEWSTWGARGYSVESNLSPGAGRTNAEINASRSRHPATEHIRQYRAAGFSAAEQAQLLNRQFGTAAYTANRVTKIAHNMGLTNGRMPRSWSRRKPGDRSPAEIEKRTRRAS